jgi:7-cyano-7-deazaguanine synthase in queuosine biosynthesis
VELAATILQEEPVTAIVSFFDEEELRTRFIPARNIIVMDSLGYYAVEPK